MTVGTLVSLVVDGIVSHDVSMQRPFGLVVFDLDGTLLHGKTVCEHLAEPLGRTSRMREIESMRTEPEIAAARIEMATWYTTASSDKLLDCLGSARLAPGAQEGIDLLRDRNVACAISSITWRFAVSWFAARLGIDHFQGTDIAADGALVHVWPRDKGTWVTHLGGRLGVPPTRIASVGDSYRDLDMFRSSSRAYFVGTAAETLPEFVTRVPSGNILSIARTILDEWTL